MIDFSSITYTILRGDDLVGDGISTGGGIPFGSDTIYTVYVCVYLCAFINVHGNPSMCVYVQCMYISTQVNKKSCRLRMATYRDGVKRKGDKIGMGL